MIRLLRRMFGPKYVRPPEKPAPNDAEAERPHRGREVYTGTATLVVYDPDSLKHRYDDEVDWWADPKDEVDELKNRNLLIIGLRADGFYDVLTTDSSEGAQHSFSLRFPSGRVFIGPGEELTGGGAEPTGQNGGFFLSVAPGDYRIAVSREDDLLTLGLVPEAPFENPAEPVVIDA